MLCAPGQNALLRIRYLSLVRIRSDYSHVPHSNVWVDNRLYTQQWSHKIIISSKKWKVCGSGRFFFSDGSSTVGFGNIVPLTHNTLLLRVQITSQSVSHWPVSAQRCCPPTLNIQRALQPPRSSLMVFRAHCCGVFNEDLRSCTRHRSTGATLTGVKYHCHFSKSIVW